ncbi:hypothetical protein CsatA_007639 [Cannabis sativa]
MLDTKERSYKTTFTLIGAIFALAGLEEFITDKSKCQEHFDVYKECKKKEDQLPACMISYVQKQNVESTTMINRHFLGKNVILEYSGKNTSCNNFLITADRMSCPFIPSDKKSSASSNNSPSTGSLVQEKKHYDKQAARHRIGHAFRNSWGRRDEFKATKKYNSSSKASKLITILFDWSRSSSLARTLLPRVLESQIDNKRFSKLRNIFCYVAGTSNVTDITNDVDVTNVKTITDPKSTTYISQ